MKIPALIIMVVTALAMLASCVPSPTVTVTVTATVTATGSSEDLSDQLTRLQSDYAALQQEYATAIANLQEQDTPAGDDLTALQAEYDSLKEAYDNMLQNAGQAGLHDPSWAELKAFIKSDDVDEVAYNLNTFACSGYAIVLRDRARRLGIRTAYIQISFPGAAGHALTAFQTTDQGLIYIDCTEDDKVAYISTGQAYGTIQIDAVQARYIDCSGNPGDFWQPLDYVETADPFGYAYYEGYRERWEFYRLSIEAYNQAVVEYNRGGGRLTQSQMLAWQDNIVALEEELGNTVYESPGITGNIETYWGDNP